MAGQGRKVWTQETLSVPDVQGYLQDQVVMRFASAAARDAVIPTPSEGMVCTLDDTDSTWRHDGTTGAAGWKPLPVGAAFGKMWRTAGLFAVTATAAKVPMDAGRASGGVTFDNTNDQLVLPFDGFYTVKLRAYSTGGTGFRFGSDMVRTRASVADATVAHVEFWKGDAGDFQAGVSDDVPLKAADRLFATAWSTGGQFAYGTNEAVGCMVSATWTGPLNGTTAF